MPRRAIGALPARVATIAATSSRNVSSSNVALTSPIAAASSADSLRGSSDSSRALPAPTMRGSVHGRPMSPATATSRKAVLSFAERAA